MKLSEALEKYNDAEFKYGSMDCCLFVCDVIKDATGKDLAAKWRGTYKTELGAFRLIHDAGGFVPLMSQAFGKVHPFWSVKKGDPVLLNAQMVDQDCIGAGLGIYDGNDIVCLTEKGLIKMPITVSAGCFNV